MKDLLPSAFSCAAHPTEYLRIFPKQHKNPPCCKSCGFKLEGKSGYLSCPKSANCYFLCSTCKVCTANHMLRNMVTLKQFPDNQLYSEDRFKCHGCEKEQSVQPARGVWHCGPCSFSVCPDCMAETATLWQSIDSE